MAERIYTLTEHNMLEPLEEELFSSEDELQALIANNPELLDGNRCSRTIRGDGSSSRVRKESPRVRMRVTVGRLTI